MKLFTKEDQETIEKLQQEVQYLRNVLDESTREVDRKNEGHCCINPVRSLLWL